MPSTSAALTPGLASFLKSLRTTPIDTSIDNLISLLKRRQIRHSRSCATATAYLLLRVISACRTTDAGKLIERVQSVGRRLVAAQPREMVVGNIVRRVLGLIRDEAEDERDGDFTLSDAGSEGQPQTPRGPEDPSDPLSLRHEGSERSSSRPPFTSLATTPISMFNLLSHPEPETSLPGTPASASPSGRLLGHAPTRDIRAEVLDGIGEIIDELGQVDDQIAAYALDHIHSNEIILTHTSSTTVQKFLLKAAAKRKFTVIHAESYPNNHEATHTTVSGATSTDEEILSTDSFQKPLIALGITVILIPDSAVFALMSRVNKVILGTHSVLANGGLVAAAGTRVIARAAKVHQTPVVVVSGVYKLSPVYPFDFESLIEYGDASKVIPYEDGDLMDQVDVQNPLYDYVPPELVDLYITNLGGHAPSYLYRIVSDHYRKEDINF
ncbi:probable translation initiation factor eIF-2B subunit beta [Aspergillus lentulus]|uniref:Translation initiation factor eIF2B subunit beta n=1 Tax=Aspergillus lentulus TaxID=293939 RepID=A0AAN4PQY8_ASPLE|nr:probable translation initiation factor eIF-2B subunit beta [Aspergillus lentulus]GAQ10972.1 probable translation initiation factor eIF-2B subunit beta [Aspergillus lentulus]GFF41655.1 probable translation initiation factor eIF-2B subunit beta [Aspergillus lentulus]